MSTLKIFLNKMRKCTIWEIDIGFPIADTQKARKQVLK